MRMIRHILFDLDNTLYSASNVMERKIAERMVCFIADFLHVSLDEAQRLQTARRKKYGTTLEWLEHEHHFTDRARYFATVHPASELAELKPDPRLRGFLLSLDMPMTVLTNAPPGHAERVLDFFNIRDLFIGVFDITYHNGRGKPNAAAFIDTLSAVNKSIEETIFLDDYPPYVKGYADLGGAAVLVDELGRYADFSQTTGIPSIKTIYELPALLAKEAAHSSSASVQFS